MQALPAAAGFGYTQNATGVSADGSVIVGTNGNKDGVTFADRAYRYTDAGGYQDLGVLPGFTRSAASNVSGDGNTVVGLSQLFPANGTVISAFRWTQSTGIVPLFFDDELSSYANAVNYDGSRIVGVSIGAAGNSRAAMWTSTFGSVDLNAYLPTLGINLTGWNLTDATGISYDGSVISGNGTFNGVMAAWIVSTSSVPEPSALLLIALGGFALIATPRRTGATRRKSAFSAVTMTIILTRRRRVPLAPPVQ
jgi:probable HAF family extracellular repeat protein